MQVNQNVNAANLLLVGTVTNRSLPSKEELNAGMGFADVLSKTNQQTYDVQSTSDVSEMKDYTSKDVNDVTTDVDTVSDNDTSESTKQTEHYSAEGKNDVEKQSQKETVVKPATEVSEEVEKNAQEDVGVSEFFMILEGFENLSEDEVKAAFEAMGALLMDVMQQFDLTLDEIGVKLQEFGMVPADLFSKEGLKEFFLNMNQIDASQLLVDENLSAQLQNFMADVSEELQQLQMIVDDLDSFVSNGEVEQLLMQTLSYEEHAAVEYQPKETFVDVDNKEPEVIVNVDAKTVSSDGQPKQSDTKQEMQQSNQQLGESTAPDEVSLTQKSTDKNSTSFENPILQAIQNAVNQVEQTVFSEQPIQQVDIIHQVVEQVRLNMNQQQTSLELQLYPEHLGKIQIHVVSKEGVMTASIVAESEAAKQAIESGLLNLKEAMEQQDLKVEAIEVMVSTMGFEANSEQQDSFQEQTGTKSRRKIDLNHLSEEVIEDEAVEIEKMKATGSSVSYLA